MLALLVLALVLSAQGFACAADFYEHWGDGRAELSSYEVLQPRYGEMRQGYGVMIFVTEEIHRETYIKVESPTPAEKRLYVLKLNNMLKFNTGIYDYSVMTSVFSEVEAVEHAFALRKVSLSAQEWCGHVFDEAQVRDGRLQGTLHSYFEREGRRDYQLERARNFASEDGLLIRMRELKGELLAVGGRMEVQLLPGLWSLRTAHAQHGLVAATLSKGEVVEVESIGAQLAAHIWTLEAEAFWKKYWVEKAYPHRILRWEHSDGGRGELKKTIRVPYWSLHDNADETYRKELDIP
ncbi:MAG: hypothetical protein ACKVJG_09160 [Candidatus Latescibacterota bacterium]|mgnify:CR=1 FL=1|jgi:hypothetical protein